MICLKIVNHCKTMFPSLWGHKGASIKPPSKFEVKFEVNMGVKKRQHKCKIMKSPKMRFRAFLWRQLPMGRFMGGL